MFCLRNLLLLIGFMLMPLLAHARGFNDTTGDSMSNFLEYALDADPTAIDVDAKQPSIVINGTDYDFTFHRDQEIYQEFLGFRHSPMACIRGLLKDAAPLLQFFPMKSVT